MGGASGFGPASCLRYAPRGQARRSQKGGPSGIGDPEETPGRRGVARPYETRRLAEPAGSLGTAFARSGDLPLQALPRAVPSVEGRELAGWQTGVVADGDQGRDPARRSHCLAASRCPQADLPGAGCRRPGQRSRGRARSPADGPPNPVPWARQAKERREPNDRIPAAMAFRRGRTPPLRQEKRRGRIKKTK